MKRDENGMFVIKPLIWDSPEGGEGYSTILLSDTPFGRFSIVQNTNGYSVVAPSKYRHVDTYTKFDTLERAKDFAQQLFCESVTPLLNFVELSPDNTPVSIEVIPPLWVKDNTDEYTNETPCYQVYSGSSISHWYIEDKYMGFKYMGVGGKQEAEAHRAEAILSKIRFLSETETRNAIAQRIKNDAELFKGDFKSGMILAAQICTRDWASGYY